MIYPPKIKEGELVCFKCETKDKPFVFHHNRVSGQYVALVCNSCNLRFVDTIINHEDLLKKLYEIMTNKMTPNTKLSENEQKTIERINEVLGID